MAYDQPYEMFGGDCYGCGYKHSMEGLKVDGVPYEELIAQTPSDNYIEIEPVTGVMTKMVRSYTMVFSIGCFEDAIEGSCQKYSQLPFPSLDAFRNKKWPIYNVTEEITIDHDAFIDSVGYITETHAQIWTWSFVLSMVTVTCLALAACFQCIWWMNTPVDEMIEDRVKRVDRLNTQHEIRNDESEGTAFFF